MAPEPCKQNTYRTLINAAAVLGATLLAMFIGWSSSKFVDHEARICVTESMMTTTVKFMEGFKEETLEALREIRNDQKRREIVDAYEKPNANGKNGY